MSAEKLNQAHAEQRMWVKTLHAPLKSWKSERKQKICDDGVV